MGAGASVRGLQFWPSGTLRVPAGTIRFGATRAGASVSPRFFASEEPRLTWCLQQGFLSDAQASVFPVIIRTE